MMTVGTPVSANGAEAYFKADFIKQEMRLKMRANENDEADENTPIGKIAEAEAVSPNVNNSKIEDSDGEESTTLKENLTILKDKNAIAESESIGKSVSEETPAEDLESSSSAAEFPAIKNSSIEFPITADSGDENLGTEIPIVENSNIENSSVENPIVEQVNSDQDGIDFTPTRTRWVGKLSEELGLTGEVSEKEFASLSRGIHPQTGEQFIRHVKPRTIIDEKGKTHQTKSHRAGLDQTLNAPKSVSLVAPYDDRVITAHWRSAIKAIETIEEFTTAKMGNVKPPERTGKAAYAAFLHFEARPDFKTNYAAPDLHTHFFEFNFARTADGRHRALETREIYRCQKLATVVYRTELLKEMTAIGYEMRIDEKTGAPEVASISRDYIEVSSPRQTEIKRTAEALGIKSTKIVASNYRRGKNFDPVEMRDRWREMDEKFGSQAANAAEQARQQTEVIKLEKQTLAPQKQIPDLPNTAEMSDTKVVAAAVDFVIAQAREQKDIEVSKRKWITRQTLLTDALNYSPTESRIDEIKAEFAEREKNGELKEFELDRRQTKLQSERENPSAKKASSAPLISERAINEGVIKSDALASFGNLENTNANLENTKANNERMTDQREETFRADTRTAVEDSLLQPVIQKTVVQDQVIKIVPAMTARQEAPVLERETVFSETVVKNSFSEQLPLFDRKDFASKEKSAAEASSNPEPPNPVIPLEKIETNHREASEIKLEIKQQSEQSFENIYDKSGILQSRTRTSGNRSGESGITADHTISAEPGNRTFRDGEFGSENNISESNIVSSITNDDAIGHNVFVGSTGIGGSESKLTDYGAEHQQENRDSANRTRTGKEQNSIVGGGKRELPDRSGSAGSGKSDDRRITGEVIEKSDSGGESDKTPFKSINPAVESENAVQAKPDIQSKTFEMETTPRLASGAGVAQIKIAGAKSAALRDHRTDDEAARGGHEITGNDREDFNAIERDGAENTGVDAESERGTDFSPKRDGAVADTYQEIRNDAGTSRASDSGRGKPSKGSDESIPTFSSQNGEVQSADGRRIENDGAVGTRISTHAQRTAGDGISNFEKTIGEDGGGDRIDSATNSGSEGNSSFKRAEIRESSQMGDSALEIVDCAVNSSSNNLLFFDEQRLEPGAGDGTVLEQTLQRSIDSGAAGKNGDRTEFQQHGGELTENIAGGGKILQSAGGGADQSRAAGVETNRRAAEKTAQAINLRRFSGGLDSQIIAEWTTIIEKSDAADFLNEIVKPKSRQEEQELFGHLDEQAALIAGRLKLPPPEPEAKPNVFKHAVALTEIEAANYEQASGEPLGNKVFEVLVEENMRRAAVPPPSKQIERLRETFSETAIESTLKLSSALKVETLNALLDPEERGLDALAITRAQHYVETNEAAAQATATLVQIAYGGQMNKFTDNFRDDLAELIYYAPTPAMDVYQNFRQFDWRQTIESFAPTVDNLAEQYKIEIKPPDTDLERDKLLADFVARQLVEAYESQNSPMEKYVQNQLTANILRAGSLEVSQPQQNSIAALTDQNLEPPKFSNALEANAHAISKYDEEQKATQAIRLTDQIREAAQIRAEKHAAMEMETERVQVLTM